MEISHKYTGNSGLEAEVNSKLLNQTFVQFGNFFAQKAHEVISDYTGKHVTGKFSSVDITLKLQTRESGYSDTEISCGKPVYLTTRIDVTLKSDALGDDIMQPLSHQILRVIDMRYKNIKLQYQSKKV